MPNLWQFFSYQNEHIDLFHILLSEPPKSPGNEWEGGGYPYPLHPPVKSRDGEGGSSGVAQGRWQGWDLDLPAQSPFPTPPRNLELKAADQASRPPPRAFLFPLTPGAPSLPRAPLLCQMHNSLELTRSLGELAFLMWTRN